MAFFFFLTGIIGVSFYAQSACLRPSLCTWNGFKAGLIRNKTKTTDQAGSDFRLSSTRRIKKNNYDGTLSFSMFYLS